MPPRPFCLLVLTLACGAPARPAAPARARELGDVALDGFEAELRALGYRVGAETRSPHADAVAVSRDAHDWYVSLRVESSTVAEGTKLLVRASVFDGPNRTLRGELAPYAIPVGRAPGRDSREALVRDLGRRAATQLDQNFAAH